MFLSECARLVESRVGGEATEAVFLCGSFAAGDESVVLETDAPILLSDVDLVVIVKSIETLVEWSRRRAELGTACEDLWRDVRFSGRVDVGVMLAGDLAAMPARPGVYDMRALGKALAGDPAILERVPAYAPCDITTREAVILVENRSVSLLGARPGKRLDGETAPYGFLYAIARVYTDIAVAALSIAGAYVPGYAARAELIRAKMGGGGNGSLSRLIDSALCGRIERWTAFKLEPSIAAAGPDPGPGGREKQWERLRKISSRSGSGPRPASFRGGSGLREAGATTSGDGGRIFRSIPFRGESRCPRRSGRDFFRVTRSIR